MNRSMRSLLYQPVMVSWVSMKAAVLALGSNDGLREDGVGTDDVLCSRVQNFFLRCSPTECAIVRDQEL